MRQARLHKVEIACMVKCSLSMREDKNLNNGYGFIEFKSKEECAKAIQYCKREAFCGERLTATMVKDAMKRDEEAENGATTDDSKPIYLKEFTDRRETLCKHSVCYSRTRVSCMPCSKLSTNWEC